MVAGAGRRLALLLEDVRCARCDGARVEIEGEPAALAALTRFGPELERLAKSATGGTPRVLLGGVVLDATAAAATTPQPVVAPALGTASGAGGGLGATPAARDERAGDSGLRRLRAEVMQEAAANAQANAQAGAQTSAAATPAAGGASGADAPRAGEGAPGSAESVAGAPGAGVPGVGAPGVGAGGALASPMESELVRAAIELFKARVVGPPKRVPMTPATGPGVSAASPSAPPVERARRASGGEGSGDE